MFIRRYQVILIGIAIVLLAASTTFFYFKLRDSSKKIDSINSLLGESTRNNIELTKKLEEAEGNFGEAAVLVVDLDSRVKALGDAIADYETSSNETMNWFIENCYFYEGNEKTADYMVLRHRDKVQSIVDDLEDFVSDYSDF